MEKLTFPNHGGKNHSKGLETSPENWGESGIKEP
jgi:hypothetical protein